MTERVAQPVGRLLRDLAKGEERLRNRRPRMPALERPRQGEMPGMVTSDAADVLWKDKQRRDAKTEKPTKEDLFDFDLRRFNLPKFHRQWPFAQEIGRKFRADFANLEFKIIVEIEGLVVRRLPSGELIVTGRHASIDGFRDDCERGAIAAMLGWTVLRFEQSQVRDGTAIDYTQRVLAAKGWKR